MPSDGRVCLLLISKDMFFWRQTYCYLSNTSGHVLDILFCETEQERDNVLTETRWVRVEVLVGTVAFAFDDKSEQTTGAHFDCRVFVSAAGFGNEVLRM